MARIDFNARRAARSEAENEPHEIALGFDAEGNERVYLVRPRMPAEFPSLLARGLFDEAFKIVLVDPDDWQRMRGDVPEEGELLAIADLYSLTPGESSASTPSSTNDGASSRPTSNASTTSTSPKPAGGKTRSGSDASTP